MKHLEQTPQQFVYEYVENHPNCCGHDVVGALHKKYKDPDDFRAGYILAGELREACSHECAWPFDGPCPYAAGGKSS